MLTHIIDEYEFSKQDIDDLLRNYERIEVSELKIGMNIRYFIYKNKKELFRIGGKIIKIDPEKKYLVLTNGNKNWSVQLKQKIAIYCELDIDDIKQKYEAIIKKLYNENKNLTAKKNKYKSEYNLLKKKLHNYTY